MGSWNLRENAPLQVVCECDPVSCRDIGAECLGRRLRRTDRVRGRRFADAVRHRRSHGISRGARLDCHAAALKRVALSGSAGPGLDPCAAVTTELTLAPGETRAVVFALGQADSLAEVRRLLRDYTQSHRADAALTEVQQQWDRSLNAVHVTTPDPGIDLMLNRWLVYQVLACRLWARSAFYQSGGAYGFRDQLQDVMALVYSVPAEARAQIVRAAARQFEEGDVQHWWHPPSGVGVRTRITDDLYFLRSSFTTML